MKPDGLTKDQNEILDLRDRVHELEEEVRQLRDKLGGGSNIIIPESWGLTAGMERVLIALYEAPGGFLNSGTLAATSAIGSVENPDGLVKTRICQLRGKLGKFGIVIETRWGRGYKMTDASRATIKALLTPAQELATA